MGSREYHSDETADPEREVGQPGLPLGSLNVKTNRVIGGRFGCRHGLGLPFACELLTDKGNMRLMERVVKLQSRFRVVTSGGAEARVAKGISRGWLPNWALADGAKAAVPTWGSSVAEQASQASSKRGGSSGFETGDASDSTEGSGESSWVSQGISRSWYRPGALADGAKALVPPWGSSVAEQASQASQASSKRGGSSHSSVGGFSWRSRARRRSCSRYSSAWRMTASRVACSAAPFATSSSLG